MAVGKRAKAKGKMGKLGKQKKTPLSRSFRSGL